MAAIFIIAVCGSLPVQGFNEGLPPKRKKNWPQNKPSHDEPCLSLGYASSMVGSADPTNMVALTQFISSAMRTFWPW